MGLTVRDLPASERPRERLIARGAESLSDQELLCCILGRGISGESVMITSQRLLREFESLRALAEASIEQLAKVRGIGHAKAVQLKAAVELARRVSRPRDDRPPLIETVEAADQWLRPALMDKKKEHFVALLLDARHHLIRLSPIAIGSLSASLVHPRELFKEAIAASAAAVIIAHNHPSGDPEPSDHDLVLTKRLVQAGKLLGIEVLDHLIVASRDTVSLKARGVIG
ncbi:MAG: DNA repair protein RadC [Candidatus Omnitrophica bacterium]|nr:DNA repair protein RadC [Candidatus Omnitrophota bacterium]